MKVSLAIVTTAMLLLSLVPASARTIYPTQPCRVYVDTDYTQIAEQCGTVGRFYHRRLFVRAARQSSYYCGLQVRAWRCGPVNKLPSVLVHGTKTAPEGTTASGAKADVELHSRNRISLALVSWCS